MEKRVLKQFVLVAALLLMGCYAQAQDEASYKSGRLANRSKKLNIELKAGRGFLSETPTEESASLFYGGGSMSFGLMLGKSFVGLGAGAEYYNMQEGSFDFPIFVSFQHYFTKDYEKGFFIGAKLGYMFARKKSTDWVVDNPYESGDAIIERIERSMKGLYWDVEAGYRFSNLNLFVSYNYRMINYEKKLYHGELLVPHGTYIRTMHTIMAGISFLLF